MPADHGLGGQPRDSRGLAGAGWPDEGQRPSQRQGHRHEAEAGAQGLGQRGGGLDGLRLRQPASSSTRHSRPGCDGGRDSPPRPRGPLGDTPGRSSAAQIVGGDLDRGGEPDAVRQFVRCARMTASSPSAARICCMASAVERASKMRRRMAQIWPSVRIRAFGWISFCDSTTVAGPEPLDDRADERADRGRGHDRRQLAAHRVRLERRRAGLDEPLQLARRHRQLPLVALAGQTRRAKACSQAGDRREDRHEARFRRARRR